MATDVVMCLLCDTEVEAGDTSRSTQVLRGDVFEVRESHVECLLRSVIGGIGHLRDHEFWCLTMQDPDGGESYRQSALAVAHWVMEHGAPDGRAES